MRVELGNVAAVEAVLDPATGEREYQRLPGERVTSFTLEDDMPLATAFLAVVDGYTHHSEVGTSPVWIETDSEGLAVLLENHYRVPVGATRPRDWGERTT